MATLVVGDGVLFLVSEHLGTLLQTTHDTVDSIKEVLLVNLFLVLTGSYEGCLVAYIGNVGAAKARRLLGQEGSVLPSCSGPGLTSNPRGSVEEG